MTDLRERTWWIQKLQERSCKGARLEGLQIVFWSNFVPEEGSEYCSSSTVISLCSKSPSGKPWALAQARETQAGLALLLMQQSAPWRAIPVTLAQLGLFLIPSQQVRQIPFQLLFLHKWKIFLPCSHSFPLEDLLRKKKGHKYAWRYDESVCFYFGS